MEMEETESETSSEELDIDKCKYLFVINKDPKSSQSKSPQDVSEALLTSSRTEYGILTLYRQVPGISIYHSSVIPHPIIILPKPFSPSALETLKTACSRIEATPVPIICGACDKIMQNKPFNTFLTKIDLQGERKKYVCAVCKFSNESEQVVKEHVWDLISAKCAFCEECSLKEATETEQNKERCAPNLSFPASLVKCQKCHIILTKENILLNNLVKAKRSRWGRKQYSCILCLNEFRNKAACHHHISKDTEFKLVFCSQCHPNKSEMEIEIDIEQPSTSTGQETISEAEEFFFVCNICKRLKDGKSFFGNLMDCVKVLRVSHCERESSYKCGFCNNVYDGSQFEELKMHLSSHKNEIKECSECRQKK